MNTERSNMDDAQGNTEKVVFDAMRQLGWILPQTPEEVRLAEQELAENPIELPDDLKNPQAVIDCPRRPIHLAEHLVVSQNVETEKNLARAARDGADISPEVEERMRRDREQAEQEADE